MSKEREKLIAGAVEKAIAGDMDAINSIEDRVTRSRAKAALAKAKRLQKNDPSLKADLPGQDDAPITNSPSENLNRVFGDRINKKFPGSIDGDLTDTHIQLKPDRWNEIAVWLKTEDELLFNLYWVVSNFNNFFVEKLFIFWSRINIFVIHTG